MALKDYKEFLGLLVFGNIENLVIACQGTVAHVDPIILGSLSLIAVIFWFVVGTIGTQVAIKYARVIEFMGGLIIFILGMQTVIPILSHWIGL